MTPAGRIYDVLTARGVRLRTEGGNLHIAPRHRLMPGEMAELRTRKASLLSLLGAMRQYQEAIEAFEALAAMPQEDRPAGEAHRLADAISEAAGPVLKGLGREFTRAEARRGFPTQRGGA